MMKKEVKMKKRNFKERKSRAVSPVVSTIILIMIVIIIAIIIILFARNFIKEIVLKEVGGNSKRVEDFCSEVVLNPILNDDGTFGVSNEGNVPVFALNIKTTNAGNSDTIPLEYHINPGYSQMIEGKNRNDYESVKIIPILLGKRKSNLVEQYTCDERYGVDI